MYKIISFILLFVVNQKERNSILNKNILDFKLAAIYNELGNLPQVAFKKINETDYLYGSIRVTVNTDRSNNLSGK